MSEFTLVVDQSTSATKAMLFEEQTHQLVHSKSITHQQIYPKPGWVEHDPDEILRNSYQVITDICSKNKIVPTSIAITNQRETVVVWNKYTGKAVYNAIVWQCSRGAEICHQLIADGQENNVREKTGLLLNPYFSASGIQWIIENVPGVYDDAQKGNLLFGTTDAWLVWNFTQGKVHATDHTNASRTLLFNIHTLSWDSELFELFRIPINMAPEVKSSDSVYGTAHLLNQEIPIAGIMGDSHGALAGQMCFEAGKGKATYGTGSSVMVQIGEKALSAPQGLVTSIAYTAFGKVYYAFEGNIHYTGATIQWLIDDLQLIQSANETEKLALSVKSTEGVYMVPAFTGLGAPWWDQDARALICGMNRGTQKAHLVRAVLESIAYQVKDLMNLVLEAGISLKELRVDGGPVRNQFLMQFQADQLQAKINKSPVNEASALGVYFMNGIARKRFLSQTDIEKTRTTDEYIHPKMSVENTNELYEGWKKAIQRTLLK